MTDVVGSPPAYSPVKSSSSTAANSRPSSPNQSTPAAPEKLAEQSVFTIAKLLDTSSSASQSLSAGETTTLIAMREKIDERLRHSEAESRIVPQNPMAVGFMNQMQLWHILQMMNPGSINFGAPKTEQTDTEKALTSNFNFQQPNGQDNQRNSLHPLAGVSRNSSNNSDLSRISRESSNASPAGSNASDGEHEDEFGLNPAGGIRKKKTRTVFSRQQVTQLEAAFNAHRYLNSGQRSQLAVTLGLTETQVKIWFQNRRNKWKRQANGEELNSSGARPSSTGPMATSLPATTVSPFGSLANTEAFRLFLQSQTSQLNPPPLFGPTAMALPQLPQMFGLTQAIKNDNSVSEISPIINNGPNGLEIARFFAANFLSNSARHESSSASNSKKSSLSMKAENSSANTPNRE